MLRWCASNAFLPSALVHISSSSLGAIFPEELSLMDHKSKQTFTINKISATRPTAFFGAKAFIKHHRMLAELDPKQISEKDNAEQHHLMLSITTATTNTSFTFSLLLLDFMDWEKQLRKTSLFLNKCLLATYGLIPPLVTLPRDHKSKNVENTPV